MRRRTKTRKEMGSDVYNIIPLSRRVYWIRENENWDVNPFIYLIYGEKRSVLIDTGAGSGDLLTFVREQTQVKDGSILVLNTANLAHQTGANHLFSAVGKMGKSHKIEDLCASSANKKYSETKTNAQWEVKNYRITRWLDDNERIYLNDDLYLTVIHTPGITPDSMVVWFEAENRLFTGHLYYQIEPVRLAFVGSDIKQYVRSFSKVLDLIQDQIQPSCIRYSAVLYDSDEPCQPTFRIFRRFLFSIIAGIISPSGLEAFGNVVFESVDKLQKLELNRDSFEILRKAQTISQALK
ncbi:unnamed protein product [Bursaphelenchus xylophilus]|uniref:(pine wood nematode) hypothetical protein n=1 Tax=Bursaphelenchus xylophilus TaxID=6326 RepID=A0A1I7SM01_BURXY|nr:unnamed protein product [Bursaphelenchus xylophilus]CAG9129949.1 unnamed protein product [Bursaphelenchus xylophilus]